MVRKCDIPMRTTRELKKEIDRIMKRHCVSRDKACDIIVKKSRFWDENEWDKAFV